MAGFTGAHSASDDRPLALCAHAPLHHRTGELEESYPHFYPEAHLEQGLAIYVAILSGFLQWLAWLPGLAAAAAAGRALTGLGPAAAMGACLAALAGTGPAWPLVVLPPLAALLHGAVAAPLAGRVLLAATVAFKRRVLGPLRPGLSLLSSDVLLTRYAILRRLLESPLLRGQVGPKAAAAMGACVHPSARTSFDQMIEFDAISVGPGVTLSEQICMRLRVWRRGTSPEENKAQALSPTSAQLLLYPVQVATPPIAV